MIGSATPTATVRAQGEDQRRWFFGGGVHTWKATEEETGGAFLLFEVEMALGKLTPLHIHPESDETMYVVAGEILMHLDGAEHRIGAGGTVVAPRGVPRVSGADGRDPAALSAHPRVLPGLLLRC